jgi:hypothetical protein
MSYRDETAAIISMAQQARPNVMGHNEPFLAQLTAFSTVKVITSGLPSLSWPPS